MTVEQSWTRVVNWLRQNAPVTAAKIRRAADPDVRDSVERNFPAAWPDDLREWYALQDGESMEVLWRCLLPE